MSFLDTGVEADRNYWYRLRLVLDDGSQDNTRSVRVQTSAASQRGLALAVATSETGVDLDYRLAGFAADVTVRIIDATGRRVRTWDQGVQPSRTYKITWDGTNHSGRHVARGLYVAELRVGDQRVTRKLLLMHR